MPRKAPIKEIVSEETAASSPLRRSSRLNLNSPTPTRVLSRRTSASEAVGSVPKQTRGRRHSYTDDADTSSKDEPEKRKSRTKRKSPIPEVVTPEPPKPKSNKTRASSVAKDEPVRSPVTRRRASQDTAEEPPKRLTRTRSGSATKTASEEPEEKPASTSKRRSSVTEESTSRDGTPIKKSPPANELVVLLESITEDASKEVEQAKPSVRRRKSEAPKVDLELSVINESLEVKDSSQVDQSFSLQLSPSVFENTAEEDENVASTSGNRSNKENISPSKPERRSNVFAEKLSTSMVNKLEFEPMDVDQSTILFDDNAALSPLDKKLVIAQKINNEIATFLADEIKFDLDKTVDGAEEDKDTEKPSLMVTSPRKSLRLRSSLNSSPSGKEEKAEEILVVVSSSPRRSTRRSEDLDKSDDGRLSTTVTPKKIIEDQKPQPATENTSPKTVVTKILDSQSPEDSSGTSRKSLRSSKKDSEKSEASGSSSELDTPQKKVVENTTTNSKIEASIQDEQLDSKVQSPEKNTSSGGLGSPKKRETSTSSSLDENSEVNTPHKKEVNSTVKDPDPEISSDLETLATTSKVQNPASGNPRRSLRFNKTNSESSGLEDEAELDSSQQANLSIVEDSDNPYVPSPKMSFDALKIDTKILETLTRRSLGYQNKVSDTESSSEKKDSESSPQKIIEMESLQADEDLVLESPEKSYRPRTTMSEPKMPFRKSLRFKKRDSDKAEPSGSSSMEDDAELKPPEPEIPSRRSEERDSEKAEASSMEDDAELKSPEPEIPPRRSVVRDSEKAEASGSSSLEDDAELNTHQKKIEDVEVVFSQKNDYLSPENPEKSSSPQTRRSLRRKEKDSEKTQSSGSSGSEVDAMLNSSQKKNAENIDSQDSQKEKSLVETDSPKKYTDADDILEVAARRSRSKNNESSQSSILEDVRTLKDSEVSSPKKETGLSPKEIIEQQIDVTTETEEILVLENGTEHVANRRSFRKSNIIQDCSQPKAESVFVGKIVSSDTCCQDNSVTDDRLVISETPEKNDFDSSQKKLDVSADCEGSDSSEADVRTSKHVKKKSDSSKRNLTESDDEPNPKLVKSNNPCSKEERNNTFGFNSSDESEDEEVNLKFKKDPPESPKRPARLHSEVNSPIKISNSPKKEAVVVNVSSSEVEVVQKSIDQKLDELISATIQEKKKSPINKLLSTILSDKYDSSNEEEESDQSGNEFVDDMAEEGEEDTPSDGSNDIVEVGEDIADTESEESEVSEDLDDSFIDDEEVEHQLSGTGDDLSLEEPKSKKSRIIQVECDSDEEIIHVHRPKKKKVVKRKKSRIAKRPTDSSTDQEEVVGSPEKEDVKIVLDSPKCTSKKIIIHENIRVSEIQSQELVHQIQEAVNSLCTSLNSPSGKLNTSNTKLALNLSVDYKSGSEEQAEGSDNVSSKVSMKKRKMTESMTEISNENKKTKLKKQRKKQVEVEAVPEKKTSDKRRLKAKSKKLAATVPAPEKRKIVVEESEPVPLKRRKKHKPKSVLEDVITETKKKKISVMKPSLSLATGGWEEGVLRIKPSVTNVAAESKPSRKFHPKDFKNRMIFETGRTLRGDAVQMSKKRGRLFTF